MTVRLDIDGPVARLLIDRPLARNAMTSVMFEAVPGLVAQADAQPGIRVIVMTSARAKLFCAGADIGELATRAGDPAWRRANQTAINRAQHALAGATKPTIAFVDGDCIGGGCGLAIACDLRIATGRARFGITPAKLGLAYPLHDTKLLIDLVGPGQARRMLFTAGLFDAAEAQRIGLVELIDETPDAVIEAILETSSHSHRQSKAIVRRILDGQIDDDGETLALFAQAFEERDFREGVAAFLEKRTPDF